MGSQADGVADVEMQGDGREILSLFFPDKGLENSVPLPVHLQMRATIEASELHVEALTDVAGGSIQGSAVISVPVFSCQSYYSRNLHCFL